MALTPQQQYDQAAASYQRARQAWVEGGQEGDEPSSAAMDGAFRALVNSTAITPQEVQASVDKATSSGLGSFYDLTGTNSNAPTTQPPPSGPVDFNALTAPATGGTSSVTPPTPQVKPPVDIGTPPVAPSVIPSPVTPTPTTTVPTTVNPTVSNPTIPTSIGTGQGTTQLPFTPLSVTPQAGSALTVPSVNFPVIPSIADQTQATRPDLISNWNNAHDPAWVAAHPESKALVEQINQFTSLADYVKADKGGPPSPGTIGNIAQANFPTQSNSLIDINNLVGPTSGTAGAASGGLAGGKTLAEDSGITPSPEGNFNVTNQGAQSGGFASAGSKQDTQTGQQLQMVNEAGTNQQVGTTASAAAGTQNTLGQTVNQSTVSTPFDIQSLVEKQLPTIAASDTARQGFLTDFMNTGGTALNSQVDQAVRNSLTGPQMTGAGDSARARAAGYAAAQIGRNNADQRLAASQQLAGATGLGTMTGALSPLYGKTDTGVNQSSTGTTQQQVGTTASNQETTGSKTGQTFDFQNLVSNENSGGTAWGNSIGKSFGQALEGQTAPASSGGCVVCTAFVDRGVMKPGAIRRAVKWKLARLKNYALSLEGYAVYGPALARQVMKGGLIARVIRPLARVILYHEVYLSAPRRLKWRLDASVAHAAFHYGSIPMGLVGRLLGRRLDVRCPVVKQMLIKNNLNFSL